MERVGFASQPLLPRFTAVMAKLANLKVLRETVLEMAGRGIRAERQGKRLRSVTLDVYNARMVIHVRGCRDLRSGDAAASPQEMDRLCQAAVA